MNHILEVQADSVIQALLVRHTTRPQMERYLPMIALSVGTRPRQSDDVLPLCNAGCQFVFRLERAVTEIARRSGVSEADRNHFYLCSCYCEVLD